LRVTAYGSYWQATRAFDLNWLAAVKYRRSLFSDSQKSLRKIFGFTARICKPLGSNAIEAPLFD
jgi:hypothetical protein